MVDSEQDERNVRWRRFAIIILVGLFAAGLYASYRVYRRYEPRILCRRAVMLLTEGKLLEAELVARHVMRLNQYNLDANRLMARITERSNSEDCVAWWGRVVRLHPGSLEDVLALSKAAMKYGVPAVAEEALKTVAEASRENAKFHAASGDAALALRKPQEAELHYATALKLEPQGELWQWKSANLQLQSSDPKVQEAARATMQRLSVSPLVHADARRALVKDALAHDDLQGALRHALELQADSEATVRDRMTYLDILVGLRGAELPKRLEEIQKTAVAESADTAALLSWMNANGMASQAIDWAGTLPPKIRKTPDVACALAFCCITMKDWNSLLGAVQTGNWGHLEYMRLALAARALDEQRQPDAARTHCDAAIALALKKPDTRQLLLQAFLSWQWQSARESLLWAIAKSPHQATAALQILTRQYFEKRDAEGLLRVSERVMELEPSNTEARNNYAMFSLLRNEHVDRACKIAQELYENDPKNPEFASTYAFALHVQGQSYQGLEVMNTLPQEKLREPSTAAYYAILLATNAETAKAAEYFELVKTALLFPEELELVRKAQEPKN